jgi:hypothetical protein
MLKYRQKRDPLRRETHHTGHHANSDTEQTK